MKLTNEERALVLGSYIAKNGATVRDAARKYGISKSTVHTDVAKQEGGGIGAIDKDICESDVLGCY